MALTGVDEQRMATARDAVTALRRAEHQVREAVAGLAEDQVAQNAGYKSTQRLLEDLARFDPGEAKQWVDQSQRVVPRRTLLGDLLPAPMPDTAQACRDGDVGFKHVRVIGQAMDLIEKLPDLEPADVAAAEQLLAENARTLSACAVAKVAMRLIDTLDPDGAAPDDAPEPLGELHLARRRGDGALKLAATAHGADAELVTEVLDALSGPAGPEDERPLGQRRMDALVDLCEQAISPTGIAGDEDECTDHQHPPAAGPGDGGHGGCGGDTGQETFPEDRDHEPGHGPGGEDCPGEDLGDDGDRDRDEDGDRDRDGGQAGDGGAWPWDEAPDDDPTEENPGDEDPAEAPGGGEAAAPGRGGGRSGAAPGSGSKSTTGKCAPMKIAGRALLSITMDYRWLTDQVGHATLDSGYTISPAEARRLACDSGIVPMVLDAKSVPLDVGRLRYSAPDGLRRGLYNRDRGCSFPGCTRRPKRCHVHHVDPHWINGGETKLSNTTLLCRYHHHVIHHDHWVIKMRDNRPWYIPPRWIDPDQTPRPGGRFPLG